MTREPSCLRNSTISKVFLWTQPRLFLSQWESAMTQLRGCSRGTQMLPPPRWARRTMKMLLWDGSQSLSGKKFSPKSMTSASLEERLISLMLLIGVQTISKANPIMVEVVKSLMDKVRFKKVRLRMANRRRKMTTMDTYLLWSGQTTQMMKTTKTWIGKGLSLSSPSKRMAIWLAHKHSTTSSVRSRIDTETIWSTLQRSKTSSSR